MASYFFFLNTGNVSLLWAFLPSFYTAYWALLPLWPHGRGRPRGLTPYVPEEARHLARDFSPRALFVLGLTVRTDRP